MAPQGVEPAAPPTDRDHASEHREADRLAYFDTLHQGFERAVRRVGGTTDAHFAIGGRIVRIRFAGAALPSHLTRALAHREIPPATPGLTLCVWDSASTGTPLPLLIESLVVLLRDRWWERLDSRREIKGYDGGRIRTSFFLGPDILSALDVERHLGLYWIAAEDKLPYWERGSPFLSLLSWWMAEQDRHYVHAGAVGRPDGGVLLAGPGGSGKSTSALAALAAGLAYASDDYCLVTDRPVPFVYSIYSTAKLKALVDFDRFPDLRDRCSNLERVGDEKAVLFLNEHFTAQVVDGFPIRALLLPRVTGAPRAHLTPATAMEAFKALAPSSLLQVPGSGPRLLHTLGRLVKQLPALHLNLGGDPATIPPAIDAALAASSGGRAS